MASTPIAADSTEKNKNENKELVFFAPECALEKVVVYPDRAEVCRRVEAALEIGQSQIVIKKLPELVDSDSIRVEGKGSAIISEVAFQSKYVPQEKRDVSKQQKELEDERDELKKQVDELLSELQIVKKQWALLDDFAKSASSINKGKQRDDKSSTNLQLDDTFFKGLKDFLQLYSQEGKSLEKTRLFLEHKLNITKDKLTAIERNLVELNQHHMDTLTSVKQCVILLECTQATKVSLFVSYVTHGASWTPSYDIRMYTTESLLKITYFGLIKQSTGEDWIDAKLFLSTASPSVGGVVPELTTAELSLQRPVEIKAAVYATKKRKFQVPLLNRNSFRAKEADVEECAFYEADAPVAMAMMSATAEVSESRASTVYEIMIRSTIPSDSVEHKVTVGLIDITPSLQYTTVPKCTPQAFMIAKVVNKSPYTFLHGDTSVFLDNTFVCKGMMKDVFPMEEFECSLGVDAAVKVTYKPLKKYRAASGILSKVISTTHEQVIEIKNTHDYNIKILLTDQFPRSSEERIKINLQEPQIDLKHPEKNKDVTINKQNNIEWNLELKPQETKEILLKYIVEHPANLTINTREFVDKS